MAEKKAATLEAIEEAAQQDRTFFSPLSTAPQTAGPSAGCTIWRRLGLHGKHGHGMFGHPFWKLDKIPRKLPIVERRVLLHQNV